jgi:arsenical pump membrane protein
LTSHILDAARQAWPAFVLVSGLLLVGKAADADGLFESVGRRLEGWSRSPLALLATCIALDVVVTATLNLDTAVVFLTPILVHAARARGADETPFLYSAVFMANASSLYLPGSNLTNLLVSAHDPLGGGSAFAGHMIVPALTATVVTAFGLVAIFRSRLRRRSSQTAAAAAHKPPLVGAGAAAIAAALTVVLGNPALAVLGVGLAAVALQIARGRLQWRGAVRAVGPFTLAALFVAAVALGVLARSWDGPSQLLASAGRWGTAGVGALTAVAVNNLPAAVLLSAHRPAYPAALLIGLNLGPNLAVTGSLSALLWFRAARSVAAKPSIRRYSLIGVVLAPLAIATALAASVVLGSGP